MRCLKTLNQPACYQSIWLKLVDVSNYENGLQLKNIFRKPQMQKSGTHSRQNAVLLWPSDIIQPKPLVPWLNLYPNTMDM